MISVGEDMLIKGGTTVSDDSANGVLDKDVGDKEKKKKSDKSKKKYDKHKHKRKDKTKSKMKEKNKDKEKRKHHNKKQQDGKNSGRSKDSVDGKHSGKSKDSLDLGQEMWPIAHYITDRKKMLEEMFSAIGWKHVKAMLPSHLKNAAVENVQELCLGELLGMSNRRILSILAGQQMENSSESEGEDTKVTADSKLVNIESSAESIGETAANTVESKKNRSVAKSGESLKKKGSKRAKERKQIGDKSSKKSDKTRPHPDKEESMLSSGGELDNPSDLDTLEIGITYSEIGDLLGDDPARKRTMTKAVSSAEEAAPTKRPKSAKSNDAMESALSDPASTSSVASDDDVELDPAASVDQKKGKTLLEILELEMRARAIRALLKQQVDDIEPAENISGSQSPELSTDLVGLSTSKLSSEEEEESEEECGRRETSDKFNAVSVCIQSKSFKKGDLSSAGHSEPSDAGNSKTKLSPNLPSDLAQRRNRIASKGSAIRMLKKSSKNSPIVQQDNVELSSSPAKQRSPSSSCLNTTSSSNVQYKCDVNQCNSRDGSQSISRTDDNACKPDSEELERAHLNALSDSILLDDSTDGGDPGDNIPTKPILIDLSDSSSKVSSRNEMLEGLSDSNDPMEITHIDCVVNEPQSSVSPVDFITTKSAVKYPSDSFHPRDGERTTPENLNDSGTPIKLTDTKLLSNISCDTVCSLEIKEESEFIDSMDDTPSELVLNESYDSESRTEEICTEEVSDELSISENSDAKGKQMDNSWASRWLQSKDVQKVVSTSKMCAKIRKRMKTAQKLKQSQSKDMLKTRITGSVEEYRTLDKSNTSADNI